MVYTSAIHGEKWSHVAGERFCEVTILVIQLWMNWIVNNFIDTLKLDKMANKQGAYEQ